MHVEDGSLGASQSEETLEHRPDRRVQLARFVQVVRAHEEVETKKRAAVEEAWASAPAPTEAEPPFKDDQDLDAFFASRKVQTPLQRFDALRADQAAKAAKKVLDDAEHARLTQIDRAAADAAVESARRGILDRLDAQEAAFAAMAQLRSQGIALVGADVVMADAPPVAAAPPPPQPVQPLA
jgi:transposase